MKTAAWIGFGAIGFALGYFAVPATATIRPEAPAAVPRAPEEGKWGSIPYEALHHAAYSRWAQALQQFRAKNGLANPYSKDSRLHWIPVKKELFEELLAAVRAHTGGDESVAMEGRYETRDGGELFGTKIRLWVRWNRTHSDFDCDLDFATFRNRVFQERDTHHMKSYDCYSLDRQGFKVNAIDRRQSLDIQNGGSYSGNYTYLPSFNSNSSIVQAQNLDKLEIENFGTITWKRLDQIEPPPKGAEAWD